MRAYRIFICRGPTSTSLFAEDVVRELRSQVRRLRPSMIIEVVRRGAKSPLPAAC